jgi:hypothetical protein
MSEEPRWGGLAKAARGSGAALKRLPDDQREALILVGAAGFSYEEAAVISGCAVGTIKSRVNRARTRLAQLLSIDNANDCRIYCRPRFACRCGRSAPTFLNNQYGIAHPSINRV